MGTPRCHRHHDDLTAGARGWGQAGLDHRGPGRPGRGGKLGKYAAAARRRVWLGSGRAFPAAGRDGALPPPSFPSRSPHFVAWGGVGGLGTPRSPSLRFGVGGRGRVGAMRGGCAPRLDPKAPQSHPCTSLQPAAGLSLLLGTPQLVGGGQPDPHIYSAGAQGRPHPLGTTPPPSLISISGQAGPGVAEEHGAFP